MIILLNKYRYHFKKKVCSTETARSEAHFGAKIKSKSKPYQDDFIPPYIADEKLDKLVAPQVGPRTYRLHWSTFIVIVYAPLAAVHGLYLLVTSATWTTVVFRESFYLFFLLMSNNTSIKFYYTWPN